MQSESLKLFFSYAHEDEQYRNELEKHLSALRNQGVIEDWHDRKLIAGKVGKMLMFGIRTKG